MKFLRVFLMILFLFSFPECIYQEDTNSKGSINIQPELDEDGFINLLNNILADKVNSDTFLTLSGRSLHIRNTFDYEGKKIRVSIIRYMNEIYISVDPGHFTSMPPIPDLTGKPYSPELIDTRGLFTPHIESQVDLTPPFDFAIRRTYDIVVVNYKGTMTVCRGTVSIYLITGALPTAPPAPGLDIYYIVAGILALAIVFVVIVLRRRKTLREGGLREK